MGLLRVETEAKAFEAGSQFAKDIDGYSWFIIESDSLIISKALSDLSPSPTSVTSIVYGMLFSKRDFRRVQISHVCKEGN